MIKVFSALKFNNSKIIEFETKIGERKNIEESTYDGNIWQPHENIYIRYHKDLRSAVAMRFHGHQ